MARTDTLGNFLTDVAEAIREKEGTTETIPASEFDTRIANLPEAGGSSESEELIYDTAVIDNLIEEACTKYIKGIMMTQSERTYYTEEPVTLYTPKATHNCYIIRKRNSEYSVLWFEPCILKRNNASQFLQSHYNMYDTRVFYNHKKFNYFMETGRNNATTYASEVYSSVEDCIDVILGKKSTTYTESTSYEWVCAQDGVYPCHYVNLPVYDTSISSNNWRQTRGISPNETIQELPQ